MPAVFPISNIDPFEAGKGQRTFIPGRNTSLFWDLKCIITCPRAGLTRIGFWVHPFLLSVGFLVRPLRGRRERDSGDTPETPPGAAPLDPAFKNPYPCKLRQGPTQ